MLGHSAINGQLTGCYWSLGKFGTFAKSWCTSSTIPGEQYLEYAVNDVIGCEYWSRHILFTKNRVEVGKY